MTVATTPGSGEQPVVPPAFRDHRQQLVAIDNMSLLVDDNDAVGVAVERNADVGAHLAYLAAQRVGRRRTAFAVDVEAVGLDADRNDIGAELPERIRRDPVAGAVGAIDHDAQTFKREIARQRALGEFDVAVVDAVDPLGAAEFASFGQALGNVGVDQPLDVLLDLVRKLVAVRAEQLDAVVVELGCATPKSSRRDRRASSASAWQRPASALVRAAARPCRPR